MKSILVAGVALAMLAFADTMHAADTPDYKAPAIAAPASWTGFYAGLGLGFRTTHSEIEALSETVGGIPMNAVDFASLTKILPFDGIGLRASAYIGFNWQFAPRWILGAEGDFGFADQTTTIAGYAFSSVFGGSDRTADGLAVNSKWDASLRGRGGFLISPATLAYVTGGVAWQHFDAVSTCANISCAVNQFSPAIVTKSITRTGWTAGIGIETVLWGPWLARAEYRYADFGSAPFIIARSRVPLVQSPTVDTTTVSMQSHIATFGLAYKFGNLATGEDPASRAFAAAPSAAVVWTGPYIGLGVGARASRTDATTTSATQADISVNLNGRAISQPINGTAFRINPYAGFNWQVGPRWVVGIEGDTGFANQTAVLQGFAFSPAIFVTEDVPDRLSVKTTWDVSLRGRLGYLLTPATLAYVTGGGAWQHYEVTSICVGPNACGSSAQTPATITNAKTKTGWTIGGGLETALWTNWLVRGEYRYADFGTSSFTLVRSSRPDFPQFNPTIAIFDVKLRTHAVTFGLAYKFN